MPAAKAMKSEDQELRESVLREIEWEHQITSKEINIAAHNHVVTLSGFAHGYPEKLAAEKAAKRVYGVSDVVNQLEVKPGLVLEDHELAREAAQAFQRNLSVPESRIEITVKDGEITLEGSVDWHFQREAAEAAVSGLGGVKAVINRVVVSESAPVRDVQARIEEALKRRAAVDPRRITVLSHDGTVELRGMANSWAEKEEAAEAAWAAPGVTRVDNNIKVVG